MRFSKFVRANSRTLIMIVMALLLVAFLIPDTIQAIGRRDRTPEHDIGHLPGRKVTTRDLIQVQADISVLPGINVRQLTDQQLLDMYLLMQEAEQAGIRVGEAEVDAVLQQSGNVNETLLQLQRAARRSPKQIRAAIARWLAMNRLSELLAAGVVDSLPRQEVAYRDSQQHADVQISVLDAKAFIPRVPEPSDEQLQEFFQQGRERTTAHTENELVFGWRLPDRVQIEYLTVDPAKVQDSISVQISQVKKYFDENAAAYTKIDTSTQPAPGQPPPKVPMTFEEAKERVRKDYRMAKAVEAAQSLVSDILSEAQRPWVSAVKDENGFLKPPPGDPLSFQELKEKYSTKYPVDYGMTELVAVDSLASIPGIGSAGINTGRNVLRMPQLARRVQGILEKAPSDGLPVLSLFEPSSAAVLKPDPVTRVQSAYQGYVYRVVKVAPSTPPQALDEVRDQVIADWKLARAFELAQAEAERLAARARAVGLAAAIEEAEALRELLLAADPPSVPDIVGPQPPAENLYTRLLPPASPAAFARTSKSLMRVGTVQELPRKIFALAEEPVSEGQRRAAAFPVASAQKWVIAELSEIKPIYAGLFDEAVANNTGNQEELTLFQTDWVAPERVKQRTGFIQAASP